MHIIKIFILLLLFSACTYIGILISNKYLNRVKDLKEIKKSLNMFSTKIKFTYEPIPQIFKEISNRTNKNISELFQNASNNMSKLSAGDAWEKAIVDSNLNLTKEDKETLKGLGNLLGKLDLDGQVSEIELVDNFLDTQIDSAEEEKKKYVKMYKTLGITIGLTIVIILI